MKSKYLPDALSFLMSLPFFAVGIYFMYPLMEKLEDPTRSWEYMVTILFMSLGVMMLTMKPDENIQNLKQS